MSLPAAATQCSATPFGCKLSRSLLFLLICRTSFKTNRSYTTYDIDPALLSAGSHALGLRVGQGFCTRGSPVTDPHVGDEYDPTAERSALLQLHLHNAVDDVTYILATDASWAVSDGPVLKDSTYFGEIYDARREQAGWDMPDFKAPPDRTCVSAISRDDAELAFPPSTSASNV